MEFWFRVYSVNSLYVPERINHSFSFWFLSSSITVTPTMRYNASYATASAVDCLQRFISKMNYYVSNCVNPANSDNAFMEIVAEWPLFWKTWKISGNLTAVSKMPEDWRRIKENCLFLTKFEATLVFSRLFWGLCRLVLKNFLLSKSLQIFLQ